MIALVTGANSGIGSHFVEQLRSLGAAKIYIGARTLSKPSYLVDLDPLRMIPIELDVTHPKCFPWEHLSSRLAIPHPWDPLICLD